MTKTDVQDGGRGQATKASLMQAALELLAERGWGNVTTRAIAERAGVNHALVHYHFGSVDALLVQTSTQMMIEAADASLQALDQVDLIDGVTRFVRDMARAVQQGPFIAASFEFLLQACRREDLKDWMATVLARYRDPMAERIADASASGEIDEVDPRGASILIAALIDGLVLHLMADPSIDVDRAIDALGTWLRRKESER